MLSKSQSTAGGGQGSFAPKKKKAPPRPPPPSAGNVKTSQSFRTADELQNQKHDAFIKRSSQSVENSGRRDLIDLATPPDSPESIRKAKYSFSKQKEPADYMYRVGASVFYIKSQLKNSSQASQAANPFSPPRPSAQAMLSSPAKHAVVSTSSTLYSNVPAQQSQFTSSQVNKTGSTKYNPTIIKRPNENNNNIIKSAIGGNNNNGNGKFGGGSLRSSSGSSDWSDFSQTSQPTKTEPQKFGNIPMAWDEPPAQNRDLPKSSSVVVPTIIKPLILNKPSLLPKPALGASVNRISPVAATTLTNTEEIQQRNYYDEPPDSDFDDDEDLDDSFTSPPMPNEPPPPPPPVEVDEWMNNTTGLKYVDSTYANYGTETNRAYAIALYDYIPDIDGDLPLQAGDLVYLIKQIDDAWLYGQCAGSEGMFPSNYVNVVVPLTDEDNQQPPEQDQTQPSNPCFFADALYQFEAEADGDINLRPGDMVKIFGRLNDDWLYGEVAGSIGQFPATFVEPVPAELPIIPT